MEFVGYDRPTQVHQILFAYEWRAPELECRLLYQFEDDPILPAAYPFPHPTTPNNLGHGATAHPPAPEFYIMPAGAQIPAYNAFTTISDGYALDIATQEGLGQRLLQSLLGETQLTTEADAPLCAESGDELAVEIAVEGAPLCTEAQYCKSTLGLAWFVAQENWYLVRVRQRAFWVGGLQQDYLYEPRYYYVRASDLPAYAFDTLRLPLLQESVAREQENIRLRSYYANQELVAMQQDIAAFGEIDPTP